MPFDPNIAMFVLVGVVFFFFIIRPQMKEKKRFAQMLANIKKGDQVLTSSGIYGTIYALKDENMIILQIADNVKIEFSKQAISKIIP